MRKIAHLHCLLFAVVLTACQQKDEAGSEQASHSDSDALKRKIHLQTSSKPPIFTASENDEDFRESVRREPEEAKSPEDAESYLREFAEKLAADAPADAVRFLIRNQLQHAAATTILREIASRWLSEDPALLKEILYTLGSDESSYDAETLLNASMFLDSDEASASSQLQFLGSLNEPRMLGVGLEALVGQEEKLDQDGFEHLKGFYTDGFNTEELQPYYPVFGEALARRDPEGLRDFAAQMPGGFYTLPFAERSLAELARSHPEIGAAWLNSLTAFDEFFKPDAVAEENIEQALAAGGDSARYQEEILLHSQQANYDKVLTQFIYALAEKYPEDALESTRAIHDPSLRAKLEANLRGRIPEK